MSQYRLGIVMDSISAINIKKDSSFAMLLAAKAKGWTLFYMEQQDLFLSEGSVSATVKQLQVFDSTERWYQLKEAETIKLNHLDVILMRKDPPFDMEYLSLIHI